MVRSFYCHRWRKTRNCPWSKMLIAAFILVISVAALMQFAMFAWRASLLRTVSEQYVNEADASLQPYPNLLSSTSFAEGKEVYRDLCPELETSPTTNLQAVSIYYAVLNLVGRVGNSILRAEGFSWTQREIDRKSVVEG